LSGRYEEFRSKGAGVAAIGMGIPEMAADFREKQDVPFPLLVDRTKQTYRALEMKKGNLWDVMGPPNWVRYAKAIVAGHGVDKPKQDPLQLGGVLVVDTGGKVVYEFRSSAAADNPPIEDVLAALP
jgi:peroxiredoxin